jgi:hypothetical protein
VHDVQTNTRQRSAQRSALGRALCNLLTVYVSAASRFDTAWENDYYMRTAFCQHNSHGTKRCFLKKCRASTERNRVNKVAQRRQKKKSNTV